MNLLPICYIINSALYMWVCTYIVCVGVHCMHGGCTCTCEGVHCTYIHVFNVIVCGTNMCQGGKPDTGKFHSSYIGMNVCGSAYENGCVVDGTCATAAD